MKPEVAVLSQAGDPESAALALTIREQGYNCAEIGFSDDLSKYDIVWMHRPDTCDITAEETALADQIIPFVEAGGKLILSMDAVRLSHAWGLEDEEVSVWHHEAIDDGFGRKVGYHANRTHPLFDGMFGGAYVWHGLQDNNNRVLGYPKGRMPEAQGTKVIATLWEYIFYHPTEKVIWQQPVGKGSILSIGCFLYYTRENFHKAILDRFTGNVIRFMSGALSLTKPRYWTEEKAEVVFTEPSGFKAFKPAAPAAWNIGTDSDALSFPANRNEVTLPTRRALVVAEERSGIKEIWTHPVMSLKDYQVSVILPDGSKTALIQPSSDVELRYNSLIRTYSAGDVVIREILVPSVESPAVVAHYEWEGGDICGICVGFASNMRFMWPYAEDALGSLFCGWSDSKSCYVVSTAEDEFVSMIGSNLPGTLVSQEADRNLLQLRAEVCFETEGKTACDIVMAAGNDGRSEVEKVYDKTLRSPEAVFTSSVEHYKDYLANTVSIQTPDEIFNQGYRWAMVSAGQFLAETPGLGTGLMAGYSSSLRGWGGGHRVSGRPGYAWYFGRDSELAALAMLSMGDFDAVKSNLNLLSDYQGVNGTIYHELTTSGSNHFDASDATPLYVVLLAEYARATGDTDYIINHMDNVHKAMEFSASTDTDGDHLIEIQHVGHGWLEGGDYFMLGTEYYLSGIWARALRDAAWLSTLTGNNDKAAAYAAEYEIVRDEIENFWNPKGYYNYAKDENGIYSTSLLCLPTFPVWLGVADEERAYTMVKAYAGADFSTDWGVRQTNDPRQEDNVGPYDECNIWPLFTGSVSLAEYHTGRYNQGFEHMMASLLCYKSASHGHVPEVLRGNSFRSGGITRHQCWSETAVTGPAIQGMLGYSCDATAGSLVLAPRIPFNWNGIKVGNLRCGNDKVSFEMTRENGEAVYRICSSARLNASFAPAFPLATTIKSVVVDGREVSDYSIEQAHEYTVLHIDMKLGTDTEVRIAYEGGASVLPVYFEAEDNALTSGIRVLSQELCDGRVKVTVQGRPGTEFCFPVYDAGEISGRTVRFDKTGKTEFLI